jgi:hypothetical protein
MSRQFTLKRVPADMVDQVQGDFESEGATVVRIPNTDGSFKLVVSFP